MPARRPRVPPTTPADLLAVLRACRLLAEPELNTLKGELASRTPDLRPWVEELVRRKMLTPYQAELLLEGRGAELMLGPYRILDWLGSGGMGQVYKAEHTLMKRVVALKIMAAESECQAPLPAPQFAFPSPFLVPRSAFLREVRAAARLQHPNIVLAFDAAEVDGLLVLVLEYVEGTDLERLVEEQGPLPVELACECVRQTALGLQYAHERGLIHGDIKPSNLLVTAVGDRPSAIGQTADSRQPTADSRQPTADGRQPIAVVKILDLGLARLAGRPLEDRVTALRAGTEAQGPQTGLAGTPDYLAPELAHDSRQATIRSDLYSLGCTFFYLLTGRVPFLGETWTEKLLQHQFDPAPSVCTLRPEVPAALDDLIARLLAKDPAQRFPKPETLALALRDWQTALPETSCPTAALELTLPTPSAFDRLGLPGPGDTPEPPPRNGHVPISSAELIDFTPVVEPEVEEALEVLETIDDEPEPPRRGRLVLAVLAAMGVGLATAGVLRWRTTAHPVEHVETLPPAVETSRSPAAAPAVSFQVQGAGERHATLAAAVAAARDGDTILVEGNNLFRSPSLNLHGKSLTLRAAPGSRPRLRWEPSAEPSPRAAFLCTDRPLTIEGVELECTAGSRLALAAAHLIYGERAPLRLAGCTLLAPHGSSLVVSRGGAHVELYACQVHAGALAVCAEAGDGGPCEVRLTGSTIRIGHAGEAAITLWAAEGVRPALLRLHLERNRVQADRVAAFRSLPAVEVEAQGNQFVFGQALVSFMGFSGADGWRRATVWRGRDNVYHAAAGWLHVDGTSGAVRTLDDWHTLWGGPEPGSVEAPPASVAAGALAR